MRLTAERLAARRGEDLIFDDLSFDFASGEALILTGRNGSGKSTLLRVAAGLLHAERGRVTFTDHTGTPRPPAEVSHYLGHRNAMKQELTVAENLSFWKAYLDDAEGETRPIEAAADAVGLGGITHLPFGYLSAGQQRRFAMAKLLLAHRPVWILDEPTAALDNNAGRLFANLVADHLDKGGIVLASTHQPLGLANAKEMRMTGFAGVEKGIWE